MYQDGPIYLEPSHAAPITALEVFGSSGGFISYSSSYPFTHALSLIPYFLIPYSLNLYTL
jgi:hypothetical protein